MNKYIYYCLSNFYEEMCKDKASSQINYFIREVESLCNSKHFTIEEKDELIKAIDNTIDSVLRTLSDSPYIQICISNNTIDNSKKSKEYYFN